MKKISLAIMVLVVALASCKKTPEVNLKYVDVERDLITVGTTTATVQCDYQYIATLKKAYLYYGEGGDEADMNAAEMRVVQNTLYVELADLKENTTYNYYYEFHNGFNSMRTALKSFKTEVSPTSVTLPTVVTASVTEITANSAKGGGEVTNDGGAEVTERGICWSTNENPTLNDNHIAKGTGMGAFTAMMNGLEANTTYHVRAYATNEVGTTYGLDREFVTNGGGGVPEGAINGLFTINENGDQVYFSQGNLQYQASTDTWRFAENQWNYVGGIQYYYGDHYGNVSGSSNNDISQTYSGWIDLFGWGTSGYEHCQIAYQPWSTSATPDDYYAYGIVSCNLYDYSGEADWGYNAISNGGNQVNLWRTPTNEEWEYLFYSRNTASNARYAKACVNGVNGIILIPDTWNDTDIQLIQTNVGSVPFETNTISDSLWKNYHERVGMVFLPITGERDPRSPGTFQIGTSRYWSSTTDLSSGPYVKCLMFHSGVADPSFRDFRYYGNAVRLITK